LHRHGFRATYNGGKYADGAIRIYAAHPQANMAKSLIEESKGNIPAAIAAAKKKYQ
jgi:hypothetical protein